MKKSEMLGKIISVILNHNCDKMQVDREFAECMANVILEVQKEHGMLPPSCYLPKLGISDNAWEPEE